MKTSIISSLVLSLFLFCSCQKERESENARPGHEGPGDRRGHLVLELDGKKYEWKGTQPADKCKAFNGFFVPPSERLTLTVHESSLCAGSKAQMGFALMLTAKSILGTFKIQPGDRKGDNFSLRLSDERYEAASWVYSTDLKVVITGYDPDTGLVDGTLNGTVAKFSIDGKSETFLKKVPISGAFRVSMAPWVAGPDTVKYSQNVGAVMNTHGNTGVSNISEGTLKAGHKVVDKERW